MSRLFNLRRKARCFYCQHTPEKPPLDPYNFECPSCTSMNHFDPKTGEIMSSEPAMYDPRANLASFSRKATPSEAAIPSKVEQSIFCRSCTVNQTLVTNMMANYLPPPSDPNYQALVETLPEYRASLETRYPIVCERCLPLVEEKLLNKEHMARSKALGGWLSGNPKQGTPRRPAVGPRHSSILKQPKERPWQARLWMIQGLLYTVTTIWTMAAYFYGMSRKRSSPVRPMSPIIITASLFWTFWDRTWLQVHRAQTRGLSMRETGRKESMRIQFIIWSSRLIMSTLTSLWGAKITEGTFGAFLAVEVALGTLALITVKAIEPPPITLSRHNSVVEKKTPTKRRSLVPTASFVTPVQQAPNPKTATPTFGAPSLGSNLSAAEAMLEEMDWTPQANLSLFEDDAFTLKPGRLSTDPTGLEGLLAGTSLAGDSSIPVARAGQSKVNSYSDLLSWVRQQDLIVMCGVVITIAILLVGAILPAWQRQKGALWDPAWDWSHFESRSPEPTISFSTEDWSSENDL